MYKTPVRQKTRHKAHLTNGHGGTKMNTTLLRTLQKNARRIVVRSLAKAKRKSAPITTYLSRKHIQATGVTFLLGICSGAAIGYLIDKNRH